MSLLKTKIQSHKILFIAIAIAFLATIGVGAFITTNALAYNGRLATFYVKVAPQPSTDLEASDFAGSKVYFLSADSEPEKKGNKKVVFEGTFDKDGFVRFENVDVGDEAYHDDGPIPFVYGGYASVKGSDGKTRDYCIQTTPVFEDFIFGDNNDKKEKILPVHVEECAHYNLKLNGGDLTFKCKEFPNGLTSINMSGNNIPVPKDSKILVQKINETVNKAIINVGYGDKVVCKYEIEVERNRINSIVPDSIKLGFDQNDINLKCDLVYTSLQSDGHNYCPVYVGTAKKNNLTFYYMGENDVPVPLDDDIKMEGLRPYIGNLYVDVEKSDEPCIAVRSINDISFNSVYRKDGTGAQYVDDGWAKDYLVYDGDLCLETVERLLYQDPVDSHHDPTLINGVRLTDIWNTYKDKGFGDEFGHFWSCAASNESSAWSWRSFNSEWNNRNREDTMCVCVSRAFK